MEKRINTYEAMFLVDAGQPSFEAASEPIQKILERFGADVLSLKQWDERKLAYEIKGRKRGLYILCYFKMDAEKLVEMEHECKLSEAVLRVLLIRKDKLTEDDINAPTPAEQAGFSASTAADAAAPTPAPESQEEATDTDVAAETDGDKDADKEETSDAGQEAAEESGEESKDDA